MDIKEIINGLKEYDAATVQNAMIKIRGFVNESIDYTGPELKSYYIESKPVVGIAVTCKVTTLEEPKTKIDWDEYYNNIDASDPVSYTHLTLPTNREV